MTDRLRAEEAARTREEDERRVQFLAFVSHELRSPLNGIKSWAHVLENELRDAEPSVRRALAGIMMGVDHQVRLIDDLLDATRLMSGNLGTDVATCSACGALQRRQEEHPMSESRKSATPMKVKSDKERPQRGPDPETLEGPGHEEAKDKGETRDETTRRGEH